MEIGIHLDTFRNVDLFHQGLYHLRFSLVSSIPPEDVHEYQDIIPAADGGGGGGRGVLKEQNAGNNNNSTEPLIDPSTGTVLNPLPPIGTVNGIYVNCLSVRPDGSLGSINAVVEQDLLKQREINIDTEKKATTPTPIVAVKSNTTFGGASSSTSNYNSSCIFSSAHSSSLIDPASQLLHYHSPGAHFHNLNGVFRCPFTSHVDDQVDEDHRYEPYTPHITGKVDFHSVIPSDIYRDELGREYFDSQAFLVRYCEEEIVLNTVVIFKVKDKKYLMQKNLKNSNLYLQCELRFCDLSPYNGAERFAERVQAGTIETHTVQFQTVSRSWNTIPSSMSSAYMPFIFDDAHFCQVVCMLHYFKTKDGIGNRHHFKTVNEKNDDVIGNEKNGSEQPGKIAKQIEDYYPWSILPSILTDEQIDIFYKGVLHGIADEKNIDPESTTGVNRTTKLPPQSIWRRFLISLLFLQREISYALRCRQETLEQCQIRESSITACDLFETEKDARDSLKDNLKDASSIITSSTEGCSFTSFELHEKIFEVLQKSGNLNMLPILFFEEYLGREKLQNYLDSLREAVLEEAFDESNYPPDFMMKESRHLRQQVPMKESSQMMQQPMKESQPSVEDCFQSFKDSYAAIPVDISSVCQATTYMDVSSIDLRPLAYQTIEDDSISAVPKWRYQGLHLFVLCHGFQGNSHDVRLLKNAISLQFPEAVFLASTSNEDNTECSFQTMAGKLVKEILDFSKEWCSGNSLGRMSFITHSIGGLIVRAAIPLLPDEYKQRLHTFISLSTPHLGYAKNASGLISAGIWVLKRWKQCPCLEELSMADVDKGQVLDTSKIGRGPGSRATGTQEEQPLSEENKLRQCALYKLSKNGALGKFKNVLLVSSFQDSYAPYESARIELAKTETGGKEDRIYAEMVRNVWSSVNPNKTSIYRLDVGFDLPAASLDTYLGRAAHIQFLENQEFMRKLLKGWTFLFR